MDCCKEKKYSLGLILNEHQKQSSIHKSNVVRTLTEVLGLTEMQSNLIVEFATKRGKCEMFSGNTDEISKLTPKLAENNISFEVSVNK